jgi:peroxiredoxin
VRAWVPFLILVAPGCLSADPRGDGLADTPVTAAGQAGGHPQTPGASLPTVPVRTLSDQPVRLEAAAGGKPALVSFWASWCEGCLAEMDALNRLDDRARHAGGLVIGVAVGEPRAKTADFARRRGLHYAQLVDEKLELADALGQKRLPATLVLDRRGKVIFTGGALDERALAAFREALRSSKDR